MFIFAKQQDSNKDLIGFSKHLGSQFNLITSALTEQKKRIKIRLVTNYYSMWTIARIAFRGLFHLGLFFTLSHLNAELQNGPFTWPHPIIITTMCVSRIFPGFLIVFQKLGLIWFFHQRSGITVQAWAREMTVAHCWEEGHSGRHFWGHYYALLSVLFCVFPMLYSFRISLQGGVLVKDCSTSTLLSYWNDRIPYITTLLMDSFCISVLFSFKWREKWWWW